MGVLVTIVGFEVGFEVSFEVGLVVGLLDVFNVGFLVGGAHTSRKQIVKVNLTLLFH